MIQFISQPKEEQWEKAASASGGAHEQSFAFGEISQIMQHSRPVRLLTLMDGEPVACIQGVGKTRIPSALIKVGGMSGGPVINPELGNDEDIATKMLHEFEREVTRILGGRVILYCWGESVFQKVCQRNGYALDRDILVFEINMERGPDYLWDRMRSNKRRKIRQARRYGVKISEMADPDIEQTYGMFKAAAQRGGFKPISKIWIKSCLEAYGRRQRASIYFASIGDNPVSCAIVVRHGQSAYCPAAGSLKEGWHARPNDLMHWEIMLSEYSKGMMRYNMGGVNTNPQSPSYGVYQWKKEYGGETRKLSVMSKTILPHLVSLRLKLGSIKNRGTP